MKYVKILGLAAMALTALMAMAGTASATTLTSPTGSSYTSKIVAVSSNAKLTGAFGSFGAIECSESTVEGTVESHGTGLTVKGKITKLTFTTCKGGEVTDPVAQPGTLELHSTGKTNEGTLTSLNAAVIVHNTILGTCTFTTASTGTDIGTIIGSATDTSHAVFNISASIPSDRCGNGTWEGTYTVTSPVPLHIDV
jgi:hypothetical protein